MNRMMIYAGIITVFDSTSSLMLTVSATVFILVVI